MSALQLRFALFFLLCAILGACRARSPVLIEESHTASPTILLPTESATPTPTPTSTATASLTPTLTSTSTETPTPAQTSAPLIKAEVIANFGNIRTGPGEVYKIMGTVGPGLKLIVLGKNEDESWIEVDLGLSQSAWISADLVVLDGDLSTVPVIAAPPTTTPTPILPRITLTVVQDPKYPQRKEYRLALINFPPKERFDWQLFRPDAQIWSNYGNYNTNAAGFGWVYFQNLTPPGVYIIVVDSESGTHVEFRFSVAP